jgi:hypothetical protein
MVSVYVKTKETSTIYFQRLLFYFQFYAQEGVSIQLLQFRFACYILLPCNLISEVGTLTFLPLPYVGTLQPLRQSEVPNLHVLIWNIR